MITVNIPNRTYQAGVIAIPERSIPVGIASAMLTIEAITWDDPDIFVSIDLELSQDNGNTWGPGGAGYGKGGTVDKEGSRNSTAWWKWSWPNPDNPNRKVRGSIVINRAIKTGGTFNLLTAAEARAV